MPMKDNIQLNENKVEEKLIEFRKATNEDLEAIAYVHYHSWMQTYLGLLPFDFLKTKSIEKSINSIKNYIKNTYISIVNGKIVGFCIYRYKARDFVNIDNASEIQGLYLLEEYHNLGIGSKLIHFAINELKAKPIVLFVLHNNQHAIDFYQHIGFVFTGNKIVQKVDGGTIQELEMIYHKSYLL